MATRSGEEDDFIDFCVEYWGNDSNIREMSRMEVRLGEEAE